MANITPIDILKVVSNKYTLVTNLLCAKHTLLAKQVYRPQKSKPAPQIHDLGHASLSTSKNGCSPNPNRTHNKVIHLVWWHT